MQIPSALPALFASLRVAAPLALVGALLAEWLVTGAGLGYLIETSMASSIYPQLWAGVVLITLYSTVLYTAISGIEKGRCSPASPSPGRPIAVGQRRAFLTKSCEAVAAARRFAAVPAAAHVAPDAAGAVVGGARRAVPEIGVVQQHVARDRSTRRPRPGTFSNPGGMPSVPPRCEPGTTRRKPFCGEVASRWIVNATDGHQSRVGPDCASECQPMRE